MFRSFLPLHNAIGFGATDFIELEIAVLLILLIGLHQGLEPLARRLARRTGWCMLALVLLAAGLRLALLGQSPVPTPNGSDEFSYLLAADTLRHFRLANPVHPLHEFFETTFVLQEPSYSSIFPIGQGMALAAGRMIFGNPWAGVIVTAAALGALCYWMLLGWTTPGWALVGGLLAVMQFGPLRYWMNTYWGGALAAGGGCLVFGSLPRLKTAGRVRDGLLLGLGIGIQMLTRPFECVWMAAAVVLFFLPAIWRRPAWGRAARVGMAAALAVAPAAAIVLLQNQQVTGNWKTLPYQVSRYEYGVPTSFTFQAIPSPHRDLTAGQELNYEEQAATHGRNPDTIEDYLMRLGGRARFYRFFFLPPLYLALPFFFLALREWRFAWAGMALAALALETNFYPYFYPHYIAGATCLFVLVSVTGLDKLSRFAPGGHAAGREGARLVVLLCAVQFVFWYGFHLFANTNAWMGMLDFDAWDDVNHGDPLGRIAVRDRLASAPGKQLVVVRYWPRHRFAEWVQNEADIDHARVIWALDRGGAENERLVHYYGDRTVWLLEPDARPPKLGPYVEEPKPAVAPPQEQKEKPSPEMNGIQLLPVP